MPLDGAPYAYTPFCDDRRETDGFRCVHVLSVVVYVYVYVCVCRHSFTCTHTLFLVSLCRFWKSGYWRNHLGNRQYHISALYVVDLQRFRRLAAGDRLRGQYQMLSQDPNSLANLDQDLPNSMIHQVPIKSLPQEWLWCETWCSDESKAAAKTIDLV